jgi:hypothetical protein
MSQRGMCCLGNWVNALSQLGAKLYGLPEGHSFPLLCLFDQVKDMDREHFLIHSALYTKSTKTNVSTIALGLEVMNEIGFAGYACKLWWNEVYRLVDQILHLLSTIRSTSARAAVPPGDPKRWMTKTASSHMT